MNRRRRRSAGQEFRGFIFALIFAGVAYWFLTSGMYLQVVTLVSDWYTDQLVQSLPGQPSPAPGAS
jgi:hypothetical protein